MMIQPKQQKQKKQIKKEMKDDEMDEEEFERNKDVEGDVVAVDTKYIKTTYIYKQPNDSLLLRTNSVNNFVLLGIYNEVITEQEYNAADDDNYSIIVNDVNPSIVETTYKKLTTTITYLSNTKRYRFKNDLVWKKMPSNRSYDNFGIAINNSVVEVVSGSEYFKTTYNREDKCLLTNKLETITNAKWAKGATGYGLSFKLPNDTTKTYSWNDLAGNPYPCNDGDPFPGYIGNKTVPLNVTSISSYMYFDVVKVGSTSPLSAYGSYQHSVKSISLDIAMSFEITIKGSVGGVFSMSPSIAENFDKMSGTHAQLLNPLW